MKQCTGMRPGEGGGAGKKVMEWGDGKVGDDRKFGRGAGRGGKGGLAYLRGPPSTLGVHPGMLYGRHPYQDKVAQALPLLSHFFSLICFCPMAQCTPTVMGWLQQCNTLGDCLKRCSSCFGDTVARTAAPSRLLTLTAYEMHSSHCCDEGSHACLTYTEVAGIMHVC